MLENWTHPIWAIGSSYCSLACVCSSLVLLSFQWKSWVSADHALWTCTPSWVVAWRGALGTSLPFPLFSFLILGGAFHKTLFDRVWCRISVFIYCHWIIDRTFAFFYLFGLCIQFHAFLASCAILLSVWVPWEISNFLNELSSALSLFSTDPQTLFLWSYIIFLLKNSSPPIHYYLLSQAKIWFS